MLDQQSKIEAILPTHFDSTMRSTFAACHRKHYHEYVLGLRPGETSIDLHAGGVFSATLERYYREFFLNKADHSIALARAYSTFSHEWGDAVPSRDTNPKTAPNMWSAVEKYFTVFPAATDPVQPYFGSDSPTFEFSFAIPLDFPNFPRHPVTGDPFVYVGRFDMFGKRSGRAVIRDEKTAQRLEHNWSEKWDLRAQFLSYCWALQHIGIPCDTVVVRGVIITKTEIRIVEAEKIYSKALIARWFEQLRRDLTTLVQCWNEGYFDYNLGDACVAYSHCPFMTVCASNKPEMWYPSYRVFRWNPLNRNPMSKDPSSILPQFTTVGNVPDKFRHLLVPEPLP